MTPGRPLQATRQRILDIIREEGEATVRALSERLNVTGTGVRQHLSILDQDGLVTHRERRGRVGRPAMVYSLTDAGAATYPARYAELAVAILQEVQAELDEGSLQSFARGVGRRLAEPHAEALQGAAAERRLQAVCRVLRAQRQIVNWERRGEGYRLNTYTCPYPGVARGRRLVCVMDVAYIGYMAGMEAQLEECTLRGDARCSYALSPVAPADSTATAPTS